MTYNQNTTIIKFQGQDFHSLLDQCLNRGQLFEDEFFPPTLASIGPQMLKRENLSNLEWKRPHDLSNGAPYFILEDVSRFDIQQGMAGDCWFLAALGSLTQNPQHLQKILMKQSFSHQYAGIFRFRFWQCGQWVEVVVDDRLPILDRKYLFVNTRRDNQEFWPCLLEKAYAKLRGSYHNLHYGYLPDALVDLTGGVVTSIDVTSSSTDMLLLIQAAAQAGSLITCATPAGPTGVATELENGLVTQHAYTVTGAEQVQARWGWEDLIRLWNPWGKTEWQGPWKDGSLEWLECRDPRKDQLYQDKEDGEFWMSCRDFLDHFSCLYICNKVPISIDQSNLICARWSQLIFQDWVVPGNPADGLWRATQLIFSVTDSMPGENTVVSFTIMSQYINIEDDRFPLNFDVFKVDPQFQHFGDKLPRTFFSQYRNVVKGIVSKTKCNLTKSFHLNPGTYVVAASARWKKMEFLARIFLKMPVSDRNLDANFKLRPMKVRKTSISQNNPNAGWTRMIPGRRPKQEGRAIPTIVLPQPSNSLKVFQRRLKAIWIKFTQGHCSSHQKATSTQNIWLSAAESTLDPMISWASLPKEDFQQNLFYKYSPKLGSFPQELAPSQHAVGGQAGPPGHGGAGPGSDTVDQTRRAEAKDRKDANIEELMGCQSPALGPEGAAPGSTGELDPEEFSNLWSRLVHCQSVFQNIQRNSGVFLSKDLWKAINVTEFLAGISVHSELLDLMVFRYGDSDGTVSFPSLVCFLMRLEAMSKAFQNLSKDGKGIYLKEMEWMNLVMYS
ncbi:LOW QUALITY PROTEIN: calpain-13 [Suncus etruscus]|uniref:LOW QUALITY PROTEIN: calpain-13 n=1 Tax=Suncus etruscus TaxID=109475 RepID=UPI0021106019|nr:LOW QUALITY PROTEIN: calpain-13 [Suncus etruscus]